MLGTHVAGAALGALGAGEGGAAAAAIVLGAARVVPSWAFLKGGFYGCAGVPFTQSEEQLFPI